MSDLMTMPLPTSVLALTTTVHVALLLLRFHRHGSSSGRRLTLLVPSAALAASPWMLPTTSGLAVGLLLHAAWFIAVDRLVPPTPASQTASTPAAAPAPPSRPSATPARNPAAATPPAGWVQTPVLAVFEESDDIRTFRMQRPEGFEFEAGQFVTVRVNVDGQPVVRCYSISSAPHCRGYLEISVKRQGLMSGALHATIRPGSTVSLRAPAGAFRYPSGDDRPVALIAGGVGITPMMSMLRHAVAAEPSRPVTLLYSVHTQRDIAYRQELRWLAERAPQTRIVVTTTRGPRSPEYDSGRVDARMIEAHVDAPKDTVFMICGPAAMIDAVKEVLGRMGVPESQVRSEAFEAAVASTAEAPTPAVAEQAPGGAAGGATLRLVGSELTATIAPGQSLLDAAEAAGADIPFACRAGVCGTCRTRLVSGDVDCRSESLDPADREDGFILPCVSWASGDCALEA